MNFYQVSEGYLGIFIFNIANGVPVFWTALKGGQRHRTKPFIIFVAWLSTARMALVQGLKIWVGT